MNSSATTSTRPTPSQPGLGFQVACCLMGAAIGGVLWVLLSVPQHLINVIFSMLVGIGAGLGAGRFSGVPRSAIGTVVAAVTAMAVLLVTQSVITQQYLTWATDNLAGAPSNPNWDGPIGALRLTLDRAAGRNGWTSNASYFYWFVSVVLAGVLAWYTAKPARRSTRPIA